MDKELMTVERLLNETPTLSDYMAITVDPETKTLLPSSKLEESVAILIGTGEIVSLEFFDQNIATVLGQNMSKEDYVTLARFCGFEQPNPVNDDVFYAMVRRIMNNFILNRHPMMASNLLATKMMISVIREVKFTKDTMIIDSINMEVVKDLKFNLLATFTPAPEMYETFKFLVQSEKVAIYLDEEGATLIELPSNNGRKQFKDLITLVEYAHGLMKQSEVAMLDNDLGELLLENV